ncbi:MAG: oxidoreductase [Methanomicrobiales archaeon]|nr:oxidoreductase [Methanomicrobiales archaeon]
MEGCTVLGALSVTTGVKDALSIVHGPSGCAHHNFSLLHATLQADEDPRFPRIQSTDLSEDDIIFGGEDTLELAIQEAQEEDIGGIFVLNTCVVDTIGDDTAAVCRKPWKIPVIYLPSAGFLGGGFNNGMLLSLQTIAERAVPGDRMPLRITLIGEKNLEFEVEENYREIVRLLELLGVRVHLRFIRNILTADLQEISRSALNILREPDLSPVGRLLDRRFGTPYLDHFPIGFEGTLSFLNEVARSLDIEIGDAMEKEREYQERVRSKFEDLRGVEVTFERQNPTPYLTELIKMTGLALQEEGIPLPVPVPDPIGTRGTERLLHRWRRTVHAVL